MRTSPSSAADNAASDGQSAAAEQAAVPAGENARRYERLPFRGRARAVVYPRKAKAGAEPVECEVLTTDLSREGISILCRRKLFRGQRLLLVLSDSSRQVEVCWCCRVWPALYAAGCRFVEAAQ